MKKIFVVVFTEHVGGNLVKKSVKTFEKEETAKSFFKTEKLKFIEDYKLYEDTDNIDYIDRHDLFVIEDLNEITKYELFIKECELE